MRMTDEQEKLWVKVSRSWSRLYGRHADMVTGLHCSDGAVDKGEAIWFVREALEEAGTYADRLAMVLAELEK